MTCAPQQCEQSRRRPRRNCSRSVSSQRLPQPARTIRVVVGRRAPTTRAKAAISCCGVDRSALPGDPRACGRPPVSAMKSSRCSARHAGSSVRRAAVRERRASCRWEVYGIPMTTIVPPTCHGLESACGVHRRGVGVFPRDAAECRRRGAALASDGRRACAARRGRPPRGGANGQPAARQRRCADHVRPGDRA